MDKPRTSTPDSVEEKLVAFAEQVGRIAGTVHGKAEGLLDRQALRDELTRVRDAASRLLVQLGGGRTSARAKKSRAKKSPAKKSSAKKSSAKKPPRAL